jgi:hypothetical protein
MAAGKFNDLRHFSFRNLVREYAANPHTVTMDMEHDLDRLIPVLVEEPFENEHHELHRRVIVVQQQHFVQAWLLGLRPRSQFGNCGLP